MGIATIQELVRVSALLTTDQNRTSLISILVEQAQDISKSDVGALYAYSVDNTNKDALKMIYKRGKYEIQSSLVLMTIVVVPTFITGLESNAAVVVSVAVKNCKLALLL